MQCFRTKKMKNAKGKKVILPNECAKKDKILVTNFLQFRKKKPVANFVQESD